MVSRAALAGLVGFVAACSAEPLVASPGGGSHDAAGPLDAGREIGAPEERDPEETSPPADHSSLPPDHEDVRPDGGDDAQDGAQDAPIVIADARPPAGPYACTLVIGINATGEWYKQGYEQLVDDTRWELMQIHNGFIEKWADPNDAYWSTPIDSSCIKNPKAPDRVVFVLSNFDYTTIDQWYPPLSSVLKNLQDKYPSVRNIELTTWVRAPGNMPCPQAPANRSTISAGEDEAIAKAVQEFPRLVTAAPKFEAHSCAEYTDNPPHPTTQGGAAWAKMIAAYYNSMP